MSRFVDERLTVLDVKKRYPGCCIANASDQYKGLHLLRKREELRKKKDGECETAGKQISMFILFGMNDLTTAQQRELIRFYDEDIGIGDRVVFIKSRPKPTHFTVKMRKTSKAFGE
jgi:hypothetical protein